MVSGFLSRLLTENTPKASCCFFLFSALHFNFNRRSFSTKGFSSFFPRHSVFDRNFREFRLGLFFSLTDGNKARVTADRGLMEIKEICAF